MFDKKQYGFTLVEILVVLVIAGILTAIALPQYTQYITKSNRRAAQACMAEYSNYMERFYTLNLRYDQSFHGDHTLPTLDCGSAGQTGVNYSYSFATDSLKRNSYTIQAEPKGSHAVRDECGTISINQIGVLTFSGKETGC